MRAKQLNIRMNTVEAARLYGLTYHYGLSSSDVVRMLVKRDYDKLKPLRAELAPKKRRS